uniref:Uncharacterized protein n=1 Tax=Anguilla anguilla TaxID=7936 RepID=A0A0E9PVT3_ANGAN
MENNNIRQEYFMERTKLEMVNLKKAWG